MDHTDLSHLVDTIAQTCANAETPSYFDCLAALDALEFLVLDFVDQDHATHEMSLIRDQAAQLHAQLTAIAQAHIDQLVEAIRAHQLDAPALKHLLNQYANSASDNPGSVKPDYDLFDDFLTHLFQVDYEPSETRPRTDEMFYLQPTPGRIIMQMINMLPFTKADRFYDLGSGLGRVPILVSLLTDAAAVGIEIEPTYVCYSQHSAKKLDVASIEFRNIDARDADLSDGTIFFMYTPFVGSILRAVLGSLRDLSHQRPITLCTYGPCTPIIEQEAWLDPLRSSTGEIYRLAIFKSTVDTFQ